MCQSPQVYTQVTEMEVPFARKLPPKPACFPGAKSVFFGVNSWVES